MRLCKRSFCSGSLGLQVSAGRDVLLKKKPQKQNEVKWTRSNRGNSVKSSRRVSLLKENMTIYKPPGVQKCQDWLFRSPTHGLWALVTHLGGAMPDTVVVFVSQSENNLLRAISLTSFIYRHPVFPAARLVAAEGKKSEKLSVSRNKNT